jgi:hypothetical protein
LQANPEYREELEQLELLDRSLRSLPEYRLSEGFTERVLRRIDQIQTPAPRVAEVRPAGRDMVATKQAAGWRTVVMAAVAVAAALLLIVYAFDTARQPTDIARSGSPQGPATLPPDPPLPPDQAPPKPWQPPKPETEIAELPKAKMQAPQTPPDTSAWQLVHALQQQSRFKLLLVYEVTIMPEGVAQSAFLNLLKRHGIRPYQALPIGERDRRSLLKQRFLDGVQVNTKGPASMDEVRLFLVSCTGRQAEAMWLDMTNRPPGFGSLFMNLTTRDAGDGVLNRLCDASQIEQRRGEAVELLGNLAMLSSAARHLGVFGGIKWVEPELLYPAATESPKEPGGAAPKLDADLTGEFRCELLFVVRNLQPLDEAPATSSR